MPEEVNQKKIALFLDFIYFQNAHSTPSMLVLGHHVPYVRV